MRFLASEPYEFANGAIGWRPGGTFDCFGPYAKVENCPVKGTDLRLTVYATSYADTFFSIPARAKYKGKYIGGYLTTDNEGGVSFIPYDRFLERLQ